jgi:hypothetical protein
MVKSYMKIDNSPSEDVEKFEYLGMTVKNVFMRKLRAD